jgi:NAD(P)-dependent dehydrogenase (short-subunit alcohol dehydrogenase family)
VSIERSTVLVTGATGKLGRRFAHGFAGLRCNVAFTTRGGDAARSLEKECLDLGAPNVACVKVDLTTEGAPALIARQLSERKMLPDVLINNARDLKHLQPGPDGRATRSGWQGELMLGVVLPYELTMAFAELQGSPLKKVINVASIYGITATNLTLYQGTDSGVPAHYGVAKAALIHLTKELAVRLAHRSIAVNAVSYGGVAGRADPAFQERYGRLCPAGRMLDDSEVFGAVKFLASDDASGMTGHNLIVDGGWTLW